jgi:hypothetical protein
MGKRPFIGSSVYRLSEEDDGTRASFFCCSGDLVLH